MLLFFLKGFYYPEDGYYGPLYHGGDLSEQEAYNNYPIRGNRSFRGGRGRGGRRGQITKNEKFVLKNEWIYLINFSI
jgi:hypothetical protein